MLPTPAIDRDRSDSKLGRANGGARAARVTDGLTSYNSNESRRSACAKGRSCVCARRERWLDCNPQLCAFLHPPHYKQRAPIDPVIQRVRNAKAAVGLLHSSRVKWGVAYEKRRRTHATRAKKTTTNNQNLTPPRRPGAASPRAGAPPGPPPRPSWRRSARARRGRRTSGSAPSSFS